MTGSDDQGENIVQILKENVEDDPDRPLFFL